MEIDKYCENCNDEFIAYRSDAKYCCSACRSQAYSKRKKNMIDKVNINFNVSKSSHAEIRKNLGHIYDLSKDPLEQHIFNLCYYLPDVIKSEITKHEISQNKIKGYSFRSDKPFTKNP